MTHPLSIPQIRSRKNVGPKITMITAYDYTMAKIFDEAGIDILLVGDSLGMVVQGQSTTLGVTLEEMIYHSRAVQRGTRHAHVVCDLPFLSYQSSKRDAIRAAGRALKEGGVSSVKLEGGMELGPTVSALVDIGIPVMGHVGLMPQRVHAMGGYKVQGRTPAAAARVLKDALSIAQAGAYALVLEGIPQGLAQEITAQIAIPTIGIGSGPDCDGQVLVCYDLLGMYDEMKPKFVKNFASLHSEIKKSTQTYIEEVQTGVFPGPEESY